ncbi:MAG: amidohydrolase family protein [Acidobacteria bacterium]|nr:amidohydrolase family protein [Acidobacteriota bacterium]
MRFLVTGLVCVAAWAQNQNLTVEEYNPKSLLVVPEHKVPRARFPFIDVHNHQNRAGGAQLDKLIGEMDDINMRVMVMLSGGNGTRLAENIERQKKKYPDRVVVFANIDFSDIDGADYETRAAAQLEKDFQAGAQGLKIFKNFGMDQKDSRGKRMPVDDPRFDKVFQMCAKYKAPVLIHTAEPLGLFLPMDKNNERWLELKLYPGRGRTPDKYPSWEDLMAEQHRLFARHPNTIFINAHLGWLGNNLPGLGALLDRLPNVYAEIAAVIEELGRQPRTARAFLTKYQDRILFGKDTYRKDEYGTYFRTLETADEYFDHDRKYHGIWKMYGLELPDEVLKKIYYKNAVRIIPGMDASKFPR